METKEFVDGDKRSFISYPPVTGYEVWAWPELQAFLDRLGVPIELPITRISISIPLEESVRVIVHTLGTDHQQEGKETELRREEVSDA